MSSGAASFVTQVTGLARLASSSFCEMGPPKSRARTESGFSRWTAVVGRFGVVAGEVRGAEPIDAALDGAGLLEVRAHVEIAHMAGDGEQGGEVAAGAGAPRGDFLRVVAVLGGVRAQPADGGFAILDLRGEDGVLAEPILDAGDGDAFLEQGLAGRVGLAAGVPAAAVDPDDQGTGGLRGEVEIEPLPGVAVLDVGEIAQDARVLGDAGLARWRRRCAWRLLGGHLAGPGGKQDGERERGEAEWNHGREKQRGSAEVVARKQGRGKCEETAG